MNDEIFEKIEVNSIYDLFDRYLYKKTNIGIPNKETLSSPNLSIASIPDLTGTNTVSGTGDFFTNLYPELDYLQYQIDNIDNVPESDHPVYLWNADNLKAFVFNNTPLTTNHNSIILGVETVNDRTMFANSIILGYRGGKLLTGTVESSGTASGAVIIGHLAGENTYRLAVNTILGYSSGQNTNSSSSVIIGTYAGGGMGGDPAKLTVFGTDPAHTYVQRIVAIGYSAGKNAVTHYDSSYSGLMTVNSIFLGNFAGENAINAQWSIFIGESAGTSTGAAYDSGHPLEPFRNTWNIFIGHLTGSGIRGHLNIAMGSNAGVLTPTESATVFNLSNSIFIGPSAGIHSPGASNSIFIGPGAGGYDTVVNPYLPSGAAGATSICIGQLAKTGGFSNSIALGRAAVNTAAFQFLLSDSITQMSLRGVNYTLPAADGAGVLTSDGAGNLSWV